MEKTKHQVTYMGCLSDIWISNYVEGDGAALMLIGADGSKWEGETVAVATKNVIEHRLNKDEVIIDSNNCPDLEVVLRKAGIVGPPKRVVNAGHCIYPVVDLLITV